MIAALLLALACTLQEPAPEPAPETAPRDAAAPRGAAGQEGAVPGRADRAAALARSVDSLPPAAAGAWDGWLETVPPAEYRAALEAYRAGDLALTWSAALDCLDAHPEHPAALSLLGGVAFRLHRHEDAVRAFERFLVHAPGEVARTRHLGHAYYSLGRYAESRAHYDRVLGSAGLRADAEGEARLGRALAAFRLGDLAAARADLDVRLAADPLDAEAWHWRATLDFDDEALEEAETAARRARALAPWDPRPAYLLARVLEESAMDDAGRRAAAQERAVFERLAALDAQSRALQATLLLDPDDHAARRALLAARAAADDGRGVLREAAALARRAPDDPDAQRLVLEALERRGRPESAAAHAALLEVRFADDASVQAALSAFHGRRGDRQAQLRCGARARDLGAGGDR